MSTDQITRLNAALESRYRIERELGEGGMATVYLADDLRHERKVALKVLKPDLAAVVGADRFLAEIKTTANLQHPHILPLHDSGEADSFLFYVMPYVDGETLRERIDREKQLPVDEAAFIATAVASALQHAHERGVIHRDIKPANILLQDGQPVVSDFGIALAVGSAGGGRLTETGLSLGTPFYMSPEQATGDQTVGPSSDVYALAAVLYEMLVGDPPYTGSTAQAVLGKIIRGVPVSATTARSSIPANVDAAIRKALELLPADRFTDAQGFAQALSDPGFRYRVDATVGTGPTRWKAIGVAAGGAVTLLAALAAWMAVEGVGTETAPPPVFTAVVSDSAVGISFPRVSEDGTVGWVENGRIMLRPPGALEAVPLPGVQRAGGFDFSPDGQSVVYADSRGPLRTVQTTGGGETTLWEQESRTATFPSWGDDGYVYFIATNVIPTDVLRVPDVGGEPEVILDRGGVTQDPVLLPGGRGLAVMLGSVMATSNRVVVLDLESGDTTFTAEGGFSPRWSATGHLLWIMPGGTAWAVPFDPDRLEATGRSVPVLEGFFSALLRSEYDISSDGTLAYLEGAGSATAGGFEFALVGPDGSMERLPLEATDHFDSSISPDGAKLAYTRNNEIWIFDFDRGSNDPLTNGAAAHDPVWSPDGTRVAYMSLAQDSVMVRALDRSHEPEVVGATDASYEAPSDWLQDGTILLSSVYGSTSDINSIPGEGGDPTRLLNADWTEAAAVVSPDESWIAYKSSRSGSAQLYVRSWPRLTGEVRISLGDQPLAEFSTHQWSPDGRTLYYHKGRELYAADVDTSDGFRVTEVRGTGTLINGFVQDVHPDGRLLVASPSSPVGDGQVAMPRLIVSANWFGALRERLSEGR